MKQQIIKNKQVNWLLNWVVKDDFRLIEKVFSTRAEGNGSTYVLETLL